MTEQQRITWLLAMPACTEVNRAMQEYSGANTAPMNKTRRQVNLGNAATWKTLTPCFSQFLKEIRLLRAHLWGTSWRKSMRLVTLMCVARKKSDRRLWIRWRAFQWRSNVQTQWEGDDTWVEGLQCALMDSRYTSTQNSCSNASLSHPMPLKTERRHSVSCCVATHRVRHTHDDTLMPRAPQKAVLANAIWTRLHQTLPDQLARFNMCWAVGHCSIV